MKQVISNTNYEGSVRLPASKSDSQRVLLAAGLANGTSIVRNVGVCSDEKAMLEVIRAIGAKVVETQEGLEITGIQTFPNPLTINVQESGLATRLLSGVFAFSDGIQTITGEGSVFRRKFSFFPKNEAVFQCGVETDEDDRLPISFHQKTRANHFVVDGSESSQNISGLLYGMAVSKRNYTFEVTDLKSKPYLQMTIKTLAEFGIIVHHKDFEKYTVQAENGLQACEYTVEGDWSSASYWLVAAALGQKIEVTGLQQSSLQADKQLTTILTNANCTIIQGNTTGIDGEKRQPIEADLTNCPDLFPALTTYAALTLGTSKLTGVHRLINKESNRAEVLIDEFSKLGVTLFVVEDALIIEGKKSLQGGVLVDAHNDHRIAMCLAIAGMFAEKPIVITKAESVEKSYPLFWEDLEKLNVNHE